jgi:HlyD family secretion protein
MRTFPALCMAVAGLFVATPIAAQPIPASVVAYGRVVPGEQIMALTLPYFQAGPQVVAKLTVAEGDRVTAGQILALSSNHEIAAANLVQAQAHEAGMAARVALVREGAKPEDVAAQAALVASEEFDVTQAREQRDRSAALHRTLNVSEAQWKNDAERLGSLENRLLQARRTLESMQHPRPNDIVVAEANQGEAKAAVALAQASLALTELRAPSAGQILKILAYPGEQPGERGVLLFGNTKIMQIRAELDISNIACVRIGAPAQATSPAWSGAIAGKVVRIAPRVDHSSILPASPSASVDRRVVEVMVRLDHPEIVASLSGAEAIVTIAASP